MVYSTENKFFFSTMQRAGASFKSLENGDIVTAKILSLKNDGSARIFFKGNVFNGNIAGSLKEGDILKMRVLITADKVLLVPESEVGQTKNLNDALFAQLGLPKNELSSTIVSFFISSQQKLEEKSIVKLFNFLNSTKKNKKKATFIAGLLENKGINLDKSLFKKVYSIIFGENFDEDFNESFSDAENQNSKENFNEQNNNENSNNDILKVINHLNKGGLHWLVFPFDKLINNHQARGSVCLLIDAKIKQFKKMVLHCKMNEELWLFSFKENRIEFVLQNLGKNIVFSKKEKAHLEKLLLFCLKDSGLTDIQIQYGNFLDDETNSVDIII